MFGRAYFYKTIIFFGIAPPNIHSKVCVNKIQIPANLKDCVEKIRRAGKMISIPEIKPAAKTGTIPPDPASPDPADLHPVYMAGDLVRLTFIHPDCHLLERNVR